MRLINLRLAEGVFQDRLAISSLLSLQPLDASDSIRREIGGFEKGDSFRMKMIRSSAFSSSLLGGKQRIKIPRGRKFRFRKGKSYKFKIIKRGTVRIGKTRLPFLGEDNGANVYARIKPGKKTSTETLTLFKKANGKAKQATLSFIFSEGSGEATSTRSIIFRFR